MSQPRSPWDPRPLEAPEVDPNCGGASLPGLENDVLHDSLAGFVTSPFLGSTEAADTTNDQMVYMRIMHDIGQEGCQDDDDDSVNNLLPPSAISNLNINSDYEVDANPSCSGGFTVEESYGPSLRNSVPPPMYTSASQPTGSSFGYAPVVHSGRPPPSFAEAIATTPPFATMPVELSPLAARYVPPMPAAQQDPILVRNEHGVFLLRPVTKPTPPYTPPLAVTTPLTPMTQCALPPATLPSLFSAVSQVGEDPVASKKVSSAYNASMTGRGRVSGSHILSRSGSGVANGSVNRGGGAYTLVNGCMGSPAASAHIQPPPPYPL
uniref:Uncharacterized protein n=1 Tax=Trypanosoma congolense (strain IL3000) TaxID=1068625 RepID=G0URY9_TRYCI|nr:conserved hypothetical protein [Trypanosoma congolense IL3000]